MVDNLALAISHAVLLLAVWKLIQRDDLDVDPRDPADEGEQGASAP